MREHWRSMVLAALLVLLLVIFTACSAAGGAEEEETPPPTPDGAVVYATNCASCHGKNAEGAGGPALKPTSLSFDEMYQVIADGRGRMPAFRGRIAESEVRAVIAFLRGE